MARELYLNEDVTCDKHQYGCVGLYISLVFVLSFIMFPSCIKAQNAVLQLADSIVKYQLESGGWCKNQNWIEGPDMNVISQAMKTGVGSTIDNGATISEMKKLVEAVKEINRAKGDSNYIVAAELEKKADAYRHSFCRGIDYLLEMQYPNGGFPQFYPKKQHKDYSTEITFNDNAMYNVLTLLKELSAGGEICAVMQVDRETMQRCSNAYDMGVQCILDCQIRVDEHGRVVAYGTDAWGASRRTVWCQQHDEVTLLPAKARAYELPSYTGFGETCALLNLLMDIEKPSAEVREAIRGGVEWLRGHAMVDVAKEEFINDKGMKDIRLIRQPGAPLLWARFYDLDEALPYYCDRDGIPKRNISEIGYERRNGYAWVGDTPSKVIQRYEQYAQQHNM